MELRDVHVWWAWVVVLANAVAGAWALAAHWSEPLRRPALWWFTGFAQVAIAVEVILGVILVASEDRDPPQFHMFYGFVALASVGIIYSYRQQLTERRYLLYGFGGLFLMGLAIRAMVIGPNR
ncbi:MAG TPA: hypothetical protein VE466_06720 [Acidimicrobiales bacterium]|nr:hypothetical protein [Acidimicrobiales bacterium]HZA86554.1 hypothetical protein [Acidimicrobiales bacterium]